MSTTEIISSGRTWEVVAPDDVTVAVSPPSAAGGNPNLAITLNYDEKALLRGQAHGIDNIEFRLKDPAQNGQYDYNGFKANLMLSFTNKLAVPVSGFVTYLYDAQTNNSLDPAAVHPTLYAHFHNITNGTSFAPETVTTSPAFGDPTPTAAPGVIEATGVLNPGQTISATSVTLHQVELSGHNNNFGMALFVTADPDFSAPVINGLPTILTLPPSTMDLASQKPFTFVSVTDTDQLPIETMTITVKDKVGNPTDAQSLFYGGLGPLPDLPAFTHTGVGTYTIGAALAGTMTKAIHEIGLTPTPGSAGSITSEVKDGGGHTDTETMAFNTPVGTVVTDSTSSITDSHGVKWSISGGQVTVNGTKDETTGRVVALQEERSTGKVWQENADKTWWWKSAPTDSWTQATPTFTLPELPASSDNTVIANDKGALVSNGQNTWSIVNGQVDVNGQIDQTTGQVIRLAYENGHIWQENADQLWWSKAVPSDAWSPANGTTVSPIPTPVQMSFIASPDAQAATPFSDQDIFATAAPSDVVPAIPASAGILDQSVPPMGWLGDISMNPQMLIAGHS
jgi:ribosome-associated protein YbcJ (S4-like RNA binding protein)